MAWTREVYALPRDHGWTAAPGHKILVLDRGAVVLEYPETWLVQPGARQIDLRDGPTRATASCVLAVSLLRISCVDWSGLPLAPLLLHAAGGDDRDRIAVGPVSEVRRDGLELAWVELRVVDPGERREARCRIALARGHDIHCLITFDVWPEDLERHSPVWDHVVHSLRLNVSVEDPVRGRRIE